MSYLLLLICPENPAITKAFVEKSVEDKEFEFEDESDRSTLTFYQAGQVIQKMKERAQRYLFL